MLKGSFFHFFNQHFEANIYSRPNPLRKKLAQTDIQTHTNRQIDTGRQTHRQTETEKQTDTQTDRDTGNILIENVFFIFVKCFYAIYLFPYLVTNFN